MSQITFSADGASFSIQAETVRLGEANTWKTETWHPYPRPVIDTRECELLTRENFWFVRRPIPALPVVKTQAQIDTEAFLAFWKSPDNTVDNEVTWNAALRWERSRQKEAR